MRNLFRKYRKIENSTVLADAQPRGIHHTVKFENPYNETWDHIWEEIKNIGISPNEERRFVSQEIYSYAAEAPLVQAQIKDSVPALGGQRCNAVKLTNVPLLPCTAKPKPQEIKASPKRIIPETVMHECKVGTPVTENQANVEYREDESLEFTLTATEAVVYQNNALDGQYNINGWHSTVDAFLGFREYDSAGIYQSESSCTSTPHQVKETQPLDKINKDTKCFLAQSYKNVHTYHLENIRIQEKKVKQPVTLLRKKESQVEFERKIYLQATALAHSLSDKPPRRNIDLSKPNPSINKPGKYRNSLHFKKYLDCHRIQLSDKQAYRDININPLLQAMKIP